MLCDSYSITKIQNCNSIDTVTTYSPVRDLSIVFTCSGSLLYSPVQDLYRIPLFRISLIVFPCSGSLYHIPLFRISIVFPCSGSLYCIPLFRISLSYSPVQDLSIVFPSSGSPERCAASSTSSRCRVSST